ncbi:MAG: HD domain-containing protein [Pseudomonadales bacterium]
MTLSSQLSFILELDKLKAVQRKARVRADANRYENSAEHSWHIAMAAHVLREYAEGDVDINRVVSMLLLHDIVEIDAGDTFAFAEPERLDAQHAQELAAAERLFGLLPAAQGQAYLALWLEFEAAQSVDACFAKAMDRILPLIQNMQNDGGSWAQHSVAKSQVLARNRFLASSAPALWEYACAQIELACERGWLEDR